MNKEFEAKLAEARKQALANTSDVRLKSDIAINDALKRESIARLSSVLTRVYDELALDSEKLDRSIKSARKSNYGRVAEMITKVASTYAWPCAETSQASEIPELQDRMLATLAENGINVDGELLLDIKEAKGFNSFLDQATFEVVNGVEPEYEELEYYLLTFAEKAGLPIIDYKMSESVWNKAEERALAKIATEKELAEQALARHNKMVGEA